MTPSVNRNKKLYSQYAGVIILALVAILVLFMSLQTTRKLMIALLGWAVCAYIPALFLLGIFVLAGRKPKGGKFHTLIYSMCFVGSVCTLHILMAKSLIVSGENYILAPFKGYATVGGVVASILTSPFVLVSNDFGLSLTLSFIVTAAFIFLAIYPFVLKMRDTSPRKKKVKAIPIAKIATNPLPKENTLFVSQIDNDIPPQTKEATSKIFEPKQPYERDAKPALFTSLLSPEEMHSRKAQDSSRILFGNEQPDKEEKPKLKILDYPANNYFSSKTKESKDKMQRAFGEYDVKEDYRNRYGKHDEPKGRMLDSYPQPTAGNEPVSPRLDSETKIPTSSIPEQPKPKKVIANPKDYINTPIRPEEYLLMVGDDTQAYRIPQEDNTEQNIAASYSAPALQQYPQTKTTSESPISPNFYASDLPSKTELQTVQPKAPFVSETFRQKAQTDIIRPEERSGFGVRQESFVPTQQIHQKPIQQNLFNDNQPAVKPYIRPKKYIVPPLDLLKQYTANGSDFPDDYAIYKAKIEETMEEFNIPAVVTDAKRGPTFTRYELKLGPGCNIKKVATLQENLTMRLEVQSIRILTPIAGKNAFGIEIPNKMRDVVGLRSILASQKFMTTDKGVQIALGKTLEGDPYVADLASMPHLLVAGATGTGKSVFINQILISILYKYSPEDVRLILIDPKKVELSIYQNLPNLLIKETIKESAHATNLLNRLTKEMDDRFSFLEKQGAVDIDNYNNDIRDKTTEPKMFRIILVVDEMADLMMKGRGQVEEPIVRIAQLGRACGIHLILATQRPTVNVITGLIKGNILARVAFSVKTAMDSRIILDEVGAESLLGKGDLIYSFKDISLRMQGSLVEPEDIRKVCSYIKANNEAEFDDKLAEQIKAEPSQNTEYTDDNTVSSAATDKELDFEQLLRKILKTFILERKASVSMAQTKHSVGYIKARKLIDAMTERGFISAEDGSKPREVLITAEEYQELFSEE